jgi:hypothetical protein
MQTNISSERFFSTDLVVHACPTGRGEIARA